MSMAVKIPTCSVDKGCPTEMIEPSSTIDVGFPVEDPNKSEATAAGLLGAITASCTLMPSPKREQCYQSIEPYEEPGKVLDPNEVVRNFIQQHGAEPLERSIELLKELIDKTKRELNPVQS